MNLAPILRVSRLAVFLWPCALLGASPEESAFEGQVRPLFEKHCTECHGAKKQKGDLRLDLKAPAFKGGESGPAVIPGNSAKSLVLQRVLSEEPDEKMPPKGERLTPREVTALRAWIEAGADWPESTADVAAKTDKRLEHWSLQPVKVEKGGLDSIDAFLQRKLTEAGLAMSPQTDRGTLIRRASLDVTGLPPSPEEVEAFVGETDPKAYEKLIGRLLGSQGFGERWARHWLDVVRFAESDGFEMNRARTNAWPYRDYVIRAFNSDKPFDQFVREQIAGDAFGEDAATGFLVGGAKDRVGSKDPVLTANQRADELHDMVSTVSSSFLGLTLNCARCHDHKFDPISAKDYYAMTAMLQGVQHGERPLRSPETEANTKRVDVLRASLAPIEASLAKVRPLARLARCLLVDDSAAPSAAGKPGVTQIEQPKNGEPVSYSPGKEKGQASDPGDITRLPNLGGNFRYWSVPTGSPENLFSWDPRVTGKHRVWLSWATDAGYARDAHYLLDRDGDLLTTEDQVEIAVVNQATFADRTPAVAAQKRWSGFFMAGEYDLTPRSIVVLRTGGKGGQYTAEVLAFEEVGESARAEATPALRPPVSFLVNEDRFSAVSAKYLRFVVTKSSNGEACLDELEIYGGSQGTKNVASGQYGTTVTASGVYAGGANPKHQIAHLNDGRFGNDFSWIANQKDGGWVQFEFSKPEQISRVVWSRDRSTEPKGKVFQDRLAVGYRIEVSLDGQDWTPVASSSDRLDPEYREKIRDIPTLTSVPPEMVEEVTRLSGVRSGLVSEITDLLKAPKVYAGVFQQPGPTHRNSRGDPMQPKEVVAPGVLAQIGKPLVLDLGTPEVERRLALAGWIVDPSNPLTARVIVNRLWHYHFGTGLVDTPSDFGLNGSRPSHPELLDWLANELVTHDWSLKHIHRLILLSSAYRQGGGANEIAGKTDSGTRLLWRFPPRRIEAETLRDTMLALSGKLDPSPGGPGFDLFESNGNYVKVYVTKAEYGPAEFRRMVYQSKPRAMLDDFFGAFDCPDAGQPAPKRNISTTPLQALNLLNSHFALQQAGYLAARLEKEVGKNEAEQVRRAFLLLYGRPAAADEIREGSEFIIRNGLPIFCRALFNSNELIRLN